MGGKNTSTTTNTSANPAAMSNYYDLLSRVGQVSQTPFVPYSGEFVAPVNQQQQTGISGINANAYSALPYLQQAGGLLTSAGTPLTASQINQYYSPYQQDVINATEQQFNNQNAIQQQQVLGNAAAQGALGGDRTAVAQSVLAGQQQTQEAPVIANLENQGYGQALQTAQQQFQQNPEAVAYGLGSTGTALENAGLTGATAQIGAGTLQQQTQQALDQALYNQFLQQQGFPFQELSWATGLETGLGGAMGGTSTTTGPSPNPLSSILGLGIAGAGAAGNMGWKPFGSKRGGRIPIRGLATGGSPFGGMPYGTGNLFSWMPTAVAPTALHIKDPSKPNATQQQSGLGGMNPTQFGQSLTNAGKALTDPNADVSASELGSAANPLPGLTAADYGGDITTDLTGGLFSGGLDLGAGLGADAAVGAAGAADAGAGLADLLPLLALANRGGRIGKAYGGLVLPKRNRIQLNRGGVPVRAGLGLASFVKRRGFDEGGAADDDGLSANDYVRQNFPGILPGVNGQPFDASDPDAGIFSPVALGRDPKYALSNLTDTGLVPTDLPPEITSGQSAPPSSGLGTTRTLAFNDGRPQYALTTPPDTTPPPATTPAEVYSAEKMLGRNPKNDFWQSLMATGLGMMASRSPYLGVAVGEGGLQGLQTYSGLKKQEQDVDLAVAKLNQQAKSEQDRIAQESKQLEETTRHNKAVETYNQEYKQFQMGQPRTIQDPFLGQRAILPDKQGVWHYVDTGEPVVGPQTPAPAVAPKTAPNGNVTTSQGTPAATPASVTPSDDPSRPFKNANATTQTAMQARQLGLHGQALLDAIPQGRRNTLEAVANYEAPITDFTKMGRAGMSQDMALDWIRQINPAWNQNWYSLMGNAFKQFFTGTSPQSPNIQSRAYNTAIGHAGDLAENLERLYKMNPGGFEGMLASAHNAGVPFMSYLAGEAQRRMASGTPEGEVWSRINAVLPFYGAETERFYAGGQGSETGRQAIQNPFNTARSFRETMGALYQQKEMFKSKTAPLEQEYANVLDAPGLKEYGTSNRNFKEWHIARDNAQRADATIDRIAREAGVTGVGAGAGQTMTAAAPGFTGRTATGPGGQKLRETSDGRWVP